VAAIMNAARTPAERLQMLTGYSDPDRLRAAIHDLCTEFGKVTSMSMMTITETRKRQALCFLRLESDAQESALMSSLGVSRFGNEVLVVVDLAR
jgi:hypothetical protein